MGMSEMFSDNADFSGITENGLKVSRVIQKTFIEVNEEGSEAAAATCKFLEHSLLGFLAFWLWFHIKLSEYFK